MNVIWYGLSRFADIHSTARDWGFVALSLGVLVMVGWYLGKRVEKRQPLKQEKALEQATNPDQVLVQVAEYHWLQEVVSSELKGITTSVIPRVESFDFTHIEKENYFEVIIELTNTSIFRLQKQLGSPSGFFKVNGSKCANLPVAEGGLAIATKDRGNIRITQSVSATTAHELIAAANKNEKLSIDMRDWLLIYEIMDKGYEGHRAVVKGGVFGMVPKGTYMPSLVLRLD